MSTTVIVGGGISGLLAAHFLRKQGADFIGLEKSAHLGGRAEVGHHRLYDREAVNLLRQEFSCLEWSEVEEAPEEFHKGSWRPLTKELEGPAEYYTRRNHYFVPKPGYSTLIQQLTESAGRYFRTLHGVAQIFPEENRLVCENAVELKYDRIYWCSELGSLSKVWMGSKAALAKVIRKEPELHCGISFEIELEPHTLDKNNTLVFNFRFKDHKISAIGQITERADNSLLQWIVFLPKKLFEDREEVAKCVRSLKREVYRDFPMLQERLRGERIVYLPSISGEVPQETKSLEILPHLIYLGPQLKLPDTQPELLNLDLTLNQLRALVGPSENPDPNPQ